MYRVASVVASDNICTTHLPEHQLSFRFVFVVKNSYTYRIVLYGDSDSR